MEELNNSSWNTKSYTSNAAMTCPPSQSAWDTFFSVGLGRERGIKDSEPQEHT